MTPVICGYHVVRRMPTMTGVLRQQIRDGAKTQTRRVMRPQPVEKFPGTYEWNGFCILSNWAAYCPVGRAEDIAAMPEPLCKGESGFVVYRDDGWIERRALESLPEGGVKWKWKNNVLSSMFMPMWAGRTVVQYVRVWPERLLDISEGDAAAEGVAPVGKSGYAEGFLTLWDRISKPEFSSKENPWVWALEWKLLVVNGKRVGGARGN